VTKSLAGTVPAETEFVEAAEHGVERKHMAVPQVAPRVGSPGSVSVVVPLRDEASTLEQLSSAVTRVLEATGRAFELIFVDDGSKDGSARVLERLVHADARVRAFRLPRNFGKAAALAVGFSSARGARVVTMDADLQDDPSDIPAMLAKLDDDYDVVSGWKRERQDRATRRVASKIFNRVTATVSGVHLHDMNCGLKAYTAECARMLATACYGDMHRYLPVIAHWLGFQVTEMRIQHHPRLVGRSRYGLERYLRGLLDLVTTVFLCRYGRRPMHVFGAAGLMMLTVGLFALAWLSIEKLALGASIGGRPLLLLGVLLVIAGLQLSLTGLVAEMVARLPGRADERRVAGMVLPAIPIPADRKDA
jgi:glycosyltransferase involved in cell wall biosynthesis